MADVNIYEGVSDILDVETAVHSDTGVAWESDSTREMVQLGASGAVTLGKSSVVDELGPQSLGLLNAITQSLPSSSESGSSAEALVASVEAAVKSPDTAGPFADLDARLEYHAPDTNTFQAEYSLSDSGNDSLHTPSLGPWMKIDETSGKVSASARNLPRSPMVNNSVMIKPPVSKNPFGIIPVSEHIYVGVSATALDLDTYEMPDYTIHGMFDGSTLKMSSRSKREARPSGPSRKILSRPDLDLYCDGMWFSIYSDFMILLG